MFLTSSRHPLAKLRKEIAEDIRELYGDEMDEQEALESADRLILFFGILLENQRDSGVE